METKLTETPINVPHKMKTPTISDGCYLSCYVIVKTYWTIEESVLCLDYEGIVEGGTLPINNQYYITFCRLI